MLLSSALLVEVSSLSKDSVHNLLPEMSVIMLSRSDDTRTFSEQKPFELIEHHIPKQHIFSQDSMWPGGLSPQLPISNATSSLYLIHM